jgi:DNA-binding transcriptional LysR family regulator
MITFDRLRYFVVAAQLEHVGRSANMLHTSPSVISSAIKELEIFLGYSLFQRKNNRIKLTSEGRALLDKAQKILEDLEQISNPSQSNEPLLNGHYRIGASHFLMQNLLIPSFMALKKDHPKATVEFVSLDTGLALSHVKSGGLDGALVFRSAYSDKVSETVLYEGYFDFYLRKKHSIFSKKKSSAISMLNELPSIAFRTSVGANFWESHPAFAKLGIVPSHQYFYDDTATALQLLDATEAWAFLPNIVGIQNTKIASLRLGSRATSPVNISLVPGLGYQSTNFFEKFEPYLRKRLQEYQIS